jgi:hypothetical protein
MMIESDAPSKERRSAVHLFTSGFHSRNYISTDMLRAVLHPASADSARGVHANWPDRFFAYLVDAAMFLVSAMTRFSSA